jgi:aminocarboxymuconate-semialdehyde decarboxylase
VSIASRSTAGIITLCGEIEPMIVDAHCHFLSPAAIEAARLAPRLYGVEVAEEGGAIRLRLGDEPSLRPLLPALHNLGAYAAFAREQGMTGALVGPLMDIAGYHLPVEQGRAWSRLVNESLAESLRDGPVNVRGLATVPLQDPPGAAAELRHAVLTLGLRGAMIDTHVRGRALADVALDPFWRAAMELGVPVILHPFVLEEVERFGAYYLHNLVGYPFETTLAAAGLILGGTLDRMPELTVVLVHGGGFVPYQLGRFDRGHRARPEARAGGAATPSGYARRFYYDTITHSARSLCFLRDVAGADRLLLGSDFPFGLGDPEPVAAVRRAGLGEADERAALGENAVRLFGLSPAGH